jgi:hypothetical protein
MLTQVIVIAAVLVPLSQLPEIGPGELPAFVPTTLEQHALVTFNARIEDYMRVHRDVEASIDTPWSFDDPEDMFEAVRTLQSGIRAVRSHARQGDIFTGDVAAIIRIRLKRALAASGMTVDELLAFITEERARGARTPRVNKPFPWALGSAMTPQLIDILPALPNELQYRFAERSLVLVDTHADLVVDILPNALPAAGSPNHAAHHP